MKSHPADCRTCPAAIVPGSDRKCKLPGNEIGVARSRDVDYTKQRYPKQSYAMQSYAKQSFAKQSDAKQSYVNQSYAK